jgi:hypothetical protein
VLLYFAAVRAARAELSAGQMIFQGDH